MSRTLTRKFNILTGTAIITMAALLSTNYARADGKSGAELEGAFAGGTAVAIGGAAVAIAAARRSRLRSDAALNDAINAAESEESGVNPASTDGDSSSIVAELDAGSAETAEATSAVSGAGDIATGVAGGLPGGGEAVELGGDGAADAAIDAVGDGAADIGA